MPDLPDGLMIPRCVTDVTAALEAAGFRVYEDDPDPVQHRPVLALQACTPDDPITLKPPFYVLVPDEEGNLPREGDMIYLADESSGTSTRRRAHDPAKLDALIELVRRT